MTREEFNAIVKSKFDAYRQKECQKWAFLIFNDAWAIAKTQSIYDYLTESDDVNIEKLFHRADTILDELYDYEMNYDIPVWTTWDDMAELIKDYLNS